MADRAPTPRVRSRGRVRRVRSLAPLPTGIAGIRVPRDDISAATWAWAQRSLPEYLLTHSVRSYCWGAAIAAGEGWSFDRRVLWTAALMHDVGLTRIPRNAECFEVEGGEIARRFLEHEGLSPEAADQVARAIVLHMQPSVTLAQGVEAVLLDRATSLDVRGAGYELVDAVRPAVVRDSHVARSIACSWPRSPAKPRSGRPARAPGCSTRPVSPAGWRGPHGGLPIGRRRFASR